jgi:biopolymer transport protein ExbD
MRFSWKINVVIASLTILMLAACNLEKEVDINLPGYEVQPVLECYLEPGKPYRLLLSTSNSYFDELPTEDNLIEFLDKILVKNALIKIRVAGEEIALRNEITVDFESLKFYNYISDNIVPENFNDEFELLVVLADGREITAKTRILPIVPIDSVAVEFRDTLARTLIFVNDPMDQKNYYRRMLHFNSLVDSFPRQDFVTDDVFVENGRLAFGHGFELSRGDTVINTIFHLDRAYFDYLNSVRNSIIANGNPFLQPGVIITNLRGNANAIGIFTGLSYDRVFTVIP